MHLVIDINADVGERAGALADGSEERLISLITSANVACGGHTGTAATMEAVVSIAHRCGVAVGAHPSYPDPVHFGRRAMTLSPQELERSVNTQVRALHEIARHEGVALRHVKPHGALYNTAAVDGAVAASIARALFEWREDVILVGLAGSSMLEVWKDQGFRVAAEAFADRRYESDGTLRSRDCPDAVIVDPLEAARQAVEIVTHQRVISVTGAAVAVEAQTLCVHGDTPGAVAIVHSIRRELERIGIRVRPDMPGGPT